MRTPEDTAGATGGDPRIDRTRAHVLSHARDLLAAGGAAAVNYSDLAKRARVTRQTLYRHWPTRESLFVDLALDGAARGMPDGSGPPAEVIVDFLRTMRDGMDEPSNAASLTALVAQADHVLGSHVALVTIVTEVRAALDAVLGPAGVRLDAGQYARLCGPILFQRFFAREPVSDRFIEHAVQRYFDSES